MNPFLLLTSTADIDLATVVASVITSAIAAIVAVVLAFRSLITWSYKRSKTEMPTKGAKSDVVRRKQSDTEASTPDLLGDEPIGEFANIPATLEAAIGAICRLSTINGGYFGFSVTDDRVSAHLTVRTGKGKLDRRYYRLADFSSALAKLLPVLKQ